LRGYGKGDELVVIQVAVPTRMSEDEKKLLEQYAGLLKANAGSKKGFGKKVKDFFK
jgi:molecular chaperone DnaJ